MIQSDAGVWVEVLAPEGRDASTLAAVLSSSGLRPRICSNVLELISKLGDGTGAVVVTEEALRDANTPALSAALAAQPTWSDYPFIYLSTHNKNREVSALAATLPANMTNVIALERPMSAASLTSAVEWALRSRTRQFATKTHLHELEQNAEHQKLMTRELAHRVKNTIAILQSIATNTFRNVPEARSATDVLLRRYAALAKAHDLLLAQNFQSARLDEIVVRSLEVHAADDRKLLIEGEPVLLSPQSALSLALVLHELGTNATKYGAYSTPNGSVSISWSVTAGEEEPTLHFTWKEHGGPPPPAEIGKRGFGSKLIESTLAAFGHFERLMEADGLRISFDAPLSMITAQEITEPSAVLLRNVN